MVTLSAMPSEKLRPRQPDVAMPRTGDAASIAKRPSSGDAKRAIDGSAQTPTTNDSPGARWSAMSPPLLTAARAMPGAANAATSSSATLPATAAIAVMKRPAAACGAQASTIRRATAPIGRGGGGDVERSARSNGSSATSSARIVWKRSHARARAAATACGSPAADTMQSIGPC